jgi:hypothetical protein
MATRKTLTEAEELSAKLQIAHPTAKIRIIANHREMRIGRAVAERQGYEVLGDDGGIMVLAQVTEFSILEVRHCDCGVELLTAAIGEYGVDMCQKCAERFQSEYRLNADAYNAHVKAMHKAEADYYTEEPSG